jgi:hypothetical protein
VFGVLVNRTIDDQFGDPTTGVMPTYHPEANWTQVTNCSGCWAKLDRTLLFNGTCHDSTYFPGVGDQTPHTMTFSFYGSAIYIFFVTLPQIAGTIPETHLNITLDGQAAGVYNFIPGPTDSYHYNVSVYSNPYLLAGQHSIVISAEIQSVMEFDYAVYSIEDGMQPSSSRHKISVGAIVGGVAGGLIVVSTLSLLLFLRRRRNSRGSAPAPIIADHDSVANGSSGPREAYLPGVWESETQPRMLSDAFPLQASASRSPRVKMAGPEQASTPHIPSPQRIHDTGYMRANLSLPEEQAPPYSID